MDFKTGVPVLEFEFVAQFDSTETIGQSRERKQLPNGGQYTPVNNPHRRNKKTAHDKGNGNDEAGGEDDATRAASPLLVLAFDILNITHVFILLRLLLVTLRIILRWQFLENQQVLARTIPLHQQQLGGHYLKIEVLYSKHHCCLHQQLLQNQYTFSLMF